jgi:signal transduction histidine kinase/ligand-binding sensor domain-containing protein/DNA-binding response OmpR family regulator
MERPGDGLVTAVALRKPLIFMPSNPPRYFLLASAFFLALHSLSAQEVNFRKLTIEDGLSQNAVSAILQDSRGFMWFGAKDGLNQYDGYSFTIFRHDPFDPETIAGNDIAKLFEDAHGGLWIGLRSGGLCYYRRETGKFLRISLPRTQGMPDFEVSALAGSDGKTLWVGSQGNGLLRLTYHPDSLPKCRIDQFVHDPENQGSLISNKVGALLTDSNDRVWVGTDQGLSVFDAQKGYFQNSVFDLKNPARPANPYDRQINSVFKDRNGTFWLGTPNGLLRYDPSTGDHALYPHRYEVFRYGWGVILKIAEDEAGHFWLASLAGLMKFEPRTGRYTYFQHDPENPKSVSYNSISSLCIDRAGIVWVGTSGLGLNLYDPKAGRFQTLSRKERPGSRIAGFSVRSILEDDAGSLWISAGVLYRWDRKTGDLKSFETHSNFPDDFGNTDFFSMIQDADGFIWAAGARGLFKYHPGSGKVVHFKNIPDNPTGIPEFEMLAVLEDAQGEIWVLGKHTLSRVIDREKGVFETFSYFPETAADRNDRAALFQAPDGYLWLGTAVGLFRFDPRSRTFRHFQHDPSQFQSLSSSHIKCIAADPEKPRQYLWIGTTGGLNRLDLKEMTFTHFMTRDGLPNEVVYGILPDEKGQLWLSTNKGLSRFDPRAGTFRNFDVKDGLQSNEFNTGAFHLGKGGEIFFGGIKGLNYFFPDDIRDNPFLPPLAITRLKILDQPAAISERITLTHRDNILSFEFAALDFSAPEKNQYAFMMEGFNKDWTYAGHDRAATYTNLPPGSYVFRVKASNNDGIWNEEGIAVNLTVLPPWWRTWWAYLIYVALLALTLFGIRKYEINRFKLRNQLKLERVESESLRKLDELKSRFFANISHEFRTPLTLIQGQLETVIAEEDQPKQKVKLESAAYNASRLLELINQLLDLSRLDAGKMELDLKTYDLVSFLKKLLNAFETQAESMRIALEFEAGEDDIPAFFDFEKMEKVFVNLIGNALKFSKPGGAIRISAGLLDDQTVEIRVKDEGIGIPAEQLPHIFDRFYQADDSDTRKYEGSGIGLAIVHEYVRLHGGAVKVSSSKVPGASGTEFVVELPRGEGETFDTVPQAQAGPAAPPSSLPAAKENAGSREIVLVVEDNPEVQAFIREQLEAHYQVMVAANGREGIAASRQEIPDLIITDLMMPEMDGYAFSRQIKNDERTSHIPIIMLTAKAGLEHKIEGLETGIEAYITKPFSVRELLVQVRTLIRERKKLRRRFASATIIKPSEVSVVPADQAFLEKALRIVEDNLGDELFRVEALAEGMHLSASQLNRKLNALVGQSGGKFIQSLRLQRAADLLRQKAGTVSEIGYQVGFSDQAYFARAFKKQFGCSPSEYS